MNADLGQMPFPPMVMNGPHFHPPMNITINQLPNMNPRAEKNPIGIQVKEYKRETEQLEKIIDKMRETGGVVSQLIELKKVSQQGLGDGYSAVLGKAAS